MNSLTPPGGMPLAAAIAHELNVECDVLVVKKIAHFFSKEVALGATSESGETVLNHEVEERINSRFGALQPDTYLSRATEEARLECINRSLLYRARYPAHSLEGKDVILVDDGMATGSTMEVAIKVARAHRAHRVIVAVPVMPIDRVAHFQSLCDELVYLMAPSSFVCVSQYYANFPQVNHGEVIDLLEQSHLDMEKRRHAST